MAIFRYSASFSDWVVTLMPSCTGVVQAGSSRPIPDTSTMHSRHAPTAGMFSIQHSVGMYFPPARATSRIVCPSRAATYSPSMRTEILSGTPSLLVMILNVATQASRRLFPGLFRLQPHHRLLEALHALRRRQLLHVVPGASAGLRRGRVAVSELRPDPLPPPRAHQPLVDVPRRLLPVPHGVRHVGCARDQIAARVELAAGGFERVSVHFQRAVVLDPQARRAH